MKKITKNSFLPHYKVMEGAQLMVSCVRRDENHFEGLFYNMARLESMIENIEKLKALPHDELLVEFQKMATDAKNELRVDIVRILRGLNSYASMLKANKKLKTLRLLVASLYDVTDSRFYDVAYDAYRTLKAFKGEFQTLGIDAEIFDELLVKINLFVDRKSEAVDAKSERTRVAKERDVLADLIFTEMQLIAKLGKQIWHGTNKAYYKDYVLTDKINKEKVPDPEEDVGEINPQNESIENL